MLPLQVSSKGGFPQDLPHVRGRLDVIRLPPTLAPMSRPALYLSDLDGTLLNEKGVLSERSRSGLIRLLEAGVQFSVASARSHYSISKLFGDVPFRLPIIEFNGAFLTDYETGEHLEINALDNSLGRDLFDRVIKSGQRPFVCSFNGEEDCLHYDELVNPGMRWYEKRRRAAQDPRLRRTPHLRETMAEQVVSLTVMDQDERAITALHAEISAAYGDHLQLYIYENEYSTGTFWLTIHDRKASKHIAMLNMRDRFAAGSSIVAVGDNVNDIEMLKAADRSVAVENATPGVQQVASLIIGHHATDSVIAFLERETFGEIHP